MTLQDAIIEALANLDHAASSAQIADYINSYGIYIRGDLSPLSPSQITARVNNYPNLFSRDENGRIVSGSSGMSGFREVPTIILNMIRDSGHRLADADISVGAIFIYYRFSRSHLLTTVHGNEHHIPKILNFLEQQQFTSSEIRMMEYIFEQFRPNLFDRIVGVVEKVDFLSFSTEQFIMFFAHWQNIFGQSQMESGVFNTPGRINNIVADQIEEDRYSNVFDPYAGQCTTITSINLKLSKQIHYTLQDFNEKQIVLGKLNLMASEIRHFSFNNVDSIHYPPNQKFDLVIFTPPFGLKINHSDLPSNIPRHLFSNTQRVPAEIVYVTQAVQSLDQDGKAIILLPDGFFSNAAFREIRSTLVEEGLISRIISLPTSAFKPFSGVKASILVLEKRSNSLRKNIELVELTVEQYAEIPEGPSLIPIRYLNRKRVDNDEIRSHNYALSVAIYNRPELERGKTYRSLSDLIKSYGKRTPSVVEYLNTSEGIPYVQPQNLARSGETPFLNRAKIDTFVEDTREVHSSFQKYLLTNDTVLLARLGKDLNATVYSGDQPILVNPNIISFSVKKSLIDPLFLVLQLREKYAIDQMNIMGSISGMRSIRIQDFDEISIWVPELKKQEIYVKQVLSSFIKSSQEKQINHANVLDQQVLDSLKHEFGNLKNPLLTEITNLQDFLSDADLLDNQISPRPGSSPIRDVFDGLRTLIGEMGSIIEDMTGALGTGKRLRRTTILDFFQNIKVRLGANEFETEIRLNESIESTDTILIDFDLLTKALRNLVNNAYKHGYGNNTVEKNILFDVSKSEDGQWLEINYINDGNPFPEGFSFQDYTTFGKKTGSISGTGIGGFLTNKVILDHRGTFEEIELKNSKLGTNINGKEVIKGIHFLIKLPLSNDEDTIQ
ncbi:N-6 DNA methylase [Pedobacter sp. WC2501]|uniref:N-6 DNA methylase n=1 Tax=Pedobacter sp. WC2501 TaxID=3461400 RepID=UPI0040459169